MDFACLHFGQELSTAAIEQGRISMCLDCDFVASPLNLYPAVEILKTALMSEREKLEAMKVFNIAEPASTGQMP